MAFSTPTFNLNVHIYTFAPFPLGLPRLTTVCNLTPSKRVNVLDFLVIVGEVVMINSWLLLPAFTDIRCLAQGVNPDFLEVPAGSGRFYGVVDVEDVAKGFSNEY